MKFLYYFRIFLSLIALVVVLPATGWSAPFAPGNIVIARVGDGSASLTSAATDVFLDEYTPTGTLVQTVLLPTALSGNNRALTAAGTSTAELQLTRSADGHFLALTGYGTAPGTPTVASSVSTDVVRVVGLVGADGSINTTTSLGSAFSGTSIRSAATVDGTNFYVAGGNSGVQYVALGGFMPTQINTAPTNLRVVNIADGNLYISSGSSPFVGLSQVGTGLPTTGSQPVTLLPGAPGNSGTNPSPYAFYFADLSASVAGVDVVYVADDRITSAGGIQKWSLVGGTWVLNGTIASSATSALRGLNGSIAGTTVTLAATSSNALFILSDNAGYNAAPSVASLPSAIVTASSNTAFRGVAFAPTSATPTIVSFSPTSGQAGDLVTITGTNFTGATSVTLNGVVITGFTVVNATTITFTVPTGATSGTIAVTTAGGTVTSTGTFTVIAPNPVPTITSLTPNTAVAGSIATNLTVTGMGFVSSSVINFNGMALTTTFVSATSLTATIPASALATAGSYNVTVTSPAPGGGTSAPATFTVTTPAPTVTGFSPASGVVGTTVTITGTNFTGATSVTLNGVVITGFTVVNATTITFTVPTGATSGTIAVTTAGGTATSTGTFTVIPPNPTPTITSLSPASVAEGSGPFTITITGTGFLTSSTVTFIGVTLPVTYISATQISINLPTGAVIGTYPIIVTNPAPGGGSSAPFNFTVTPAATITALSPNTKVAGSATFPITVTGTNFVSGSVISFNGVALTTTFVSTTSLTASVPASAVATVGTFNVTVTNPANSVSAPATFTVTAPAPTITSFTPTTGGPGIPVTITGTNFTGATVVRIGSFNVSGFMVVNATTITFTVPGGTGSVNGLITVITPGGTAVSTGTFNLVSATLAAQALPGLSVFPNPAIDRVTIELPTSAAATVALRDLTGRVVLAPALLAADHQLLLPASLASGIYLLEVQQGSATAIRRIEKR